MNISMPPLMYRVYVKGPSGELENYDPMVLIPQHRIKLTILECYVLPHEHTAQTLYENSLFLVWICVFSSAGDT